MPKDERLVYDCFCFNNEIEVLQTRFATLDSVVDKFIVVESDKTQSLLPKPFIFNKNRKLFHKYLHKVIWVDVRDCPTNEGNLWNMENFQRNQIMRGLKYLEAKNEDFIMISDVDEIPNPEGVKFLKEKEDFHICAFNMVFHAYYANLISPGKNWIGTVALRYDVLKALTPQEVRNVKDILPYINGGNHLSWLGGFERVKQKLLSCIEPLDKSTIPSDEELKSRFLNQIKDGGQFNLINNDNSTPLVKLQDESILPKFLVENKEQYLHLFLS